MFQKIREREPRSSRLTKSPTPGPGFGTATRRSAERSYRRIAAGLNNFVREAFMDELADAAQADPLEIRLRNLDDPRLAAVLHTAADRFRWQQRKTRARGRGIGIAGGTEKASYVAACVGVGIDRTRGTNTVHEICQAFECGVIQNPKNLRAQVEGCIIMGLGGALREEIRFEYGRLLNGSLSQYPVPRFKDVPQMEIILLDRKDLPSAGAGETPLIAVAPAIANAVYGGGIRLRSLPVRGEAPRNS